MDYKLRQIVAEVTKSCNFRCLHCASACTPRRGDNELSVEEWRDLFFGPAAALGAERIVLSGGEPTLKAGFPDMCRYARESGLDYAFITNGFRLSDELLETIAVYHPYAVGFSIDGLKDTHNLIRQNSKGWGSLMKSISAVQQFGIDICAVTTVSKMNLGEIERLGEFLALAEVESWQIQIAMPAGRMTGQRDHVLDEEDFQKLCRIVYHMRQKHPEVYTQAADCFGLAPAGLLRDEDWGGCGAGISGIGMDAEGNVMPCLSVREDMCAGNVRERSLADIWNGEDSFAFARRFDPEAAKGGSCEECVFVTQCRGGCLSQSLSFNGRLHSSPFCYYRSYEKE